jgi:hypothetical protein
MDHLEQLAGMDYFAGQAGDAINGLLMDFTRLGRVKQL